MKRDNLDGDHFVTIDRRGLHRLVHCVRGRRVEFNEEIQEDRMPDPELPRFATGTGFRFSIDRLPAGIIASREIGFGSLIFKMVKRL